jgi:hypothetical protein
VNSLVPCLVDLVPISVVAASRFPCPLLMLVLDCVERRSSLTMVVLVQSGKVGVLPLYLLVVCSSCMNSDWRRSVSCPRSFQLCRRHFS